MLQKMAALDDGHDQSASLAMFTLKSSGTAEEMQSLTPGKWAWSGHLEEMATRRNNFHVLDLKI